MGLEQKTRDHTEVATTAAQGPEQVRMLVLVGGDQAAIREDDVGLQQVIDRQPVLARQVAGATAEREASNPGGGDDAERHGSPTAWVA